ncbi:oligosaccharide flippase family protein [uncultured Lamprocystis sp.]|jgi:O-antigen/teichoic acid export membrane protein|uniref:lipopolysaccharide biosynthesis protein n=1 Tax=uncultured Lamprocystis sp. TaxID=543132 RepID=UPI002600FC7A|nr:oligosaccharide flippase family protein [uncultured Lamprocystis sp.]
MLKRNLVANYLGQIWAAVMGFAFIPLYIKYLGIEAYGLIGLFALFQSWLALFDIGMKPTLNREMARFTGGIHTVASIRDLLRSIEVVMFSVALSIAAGVGFASTWLASSWVRAESLPISVVAQAILIMGLMTALQFVEGIYSSSLVGLQRQVLLNVIQSSMATLRGLGAIAILAWVLPTIQAFFLWQVFICLTSLSILRIMTYASLPRGERGGRFSISALRGIWRFAGGMLALTLLSLLLTQVDKILLAKLLTLSEYGYYVLAGVVAGAIYLLTSPIAQAWYPRMSQLQATGNTDALIHIYHQGAQLVSVIVGSAALVLIVYAETFLQIWTRDPSLAARVAPLMSLLLLGNLLNALLWIPYQTQLAHGWTSLAVRINTVSVLFIVPAILWITPHYGPIGAAWVWTTFNACYVLIGIHFMHRRILIHEKWRWYSLDIVAPLLTSGLVVAGLRWALPRAESSLEQFATLALVSVLALLAAGLAADRVRSQAWAILRMRWNNRSTRRHAMAPE